MTNRTCASNCPLRSKQTIDSIGVMEKTLTICVIAGEASGDLHGANLVRALKRRHPDVQVFGIGGDQMESEGVELLYHVREMGFLGLWEVVRHLPFIRRVFGELVRSLDQRRPELVLLIDYPGFNLRFAKAAKKKGVPVYYYICPQVWAWGKRRVRIIRRWVDRLAVILPFEADFFRKHGIDARFVGHPLKDTVHTSQTRADFFHSLELDPAAPTLGLLPGSRMQEIHRLLPVMVATCRRLRARFPNIQILLGAAPTLDDDAYNPALSDTPFIHLVRDAVHDLMAHSNAVLVASGTATLETAILNTPMAIVYKVSPVTWFFGKIMVRLKHIGLVNIIAGREVVPELLQHRATAQRIAQVAERLLTDGALRTRIQHDLSRVVEALGEPGASERTAEDALNFIREKHGGSVVSDSRSARSDR